MHDEHTQQTLGVIKLTAIITIHIKSCMISYATDASIGTVLWFNYV